MNVLVIDTGNLSTYSLVECLEKQGCSVSVYASTCSQRTIDVAIKKARPKAIVLAAGAEGQDLSELCSIVHNHHKTIPFLGIGTGMHVLIEAFEGRVDRAPSVMHGRTCRVSHDGKGIFRNVPEPFTAGRYNSMSGADIPHDFEISARDEQGAVMAIKHKSSSIVGLQFHPESVLTPSGQDIISHILSEFK